MEIIENYLDDSDFESFILDLENFLPIPEQDIPLFKIDNFFPERKFPEVWSDCEDVPQYLTRVSEEKVIISALAVYCSEKERIVKIGDQRYLLTPNSLAFPNSTIEITDEKSYLDGGKKKRISPTGNLLIFSCRNPKKGYRGNLLADLKLRGGLDPIYLILLYLDFPDLKNLYHENPVIFSLLIQSSEAGKFWCRYWEKNYGSKIPENPLRTLIKIEFESQFYCSEDTNEKEAELKTLAGFNAEKKFMKEFLEYRKSGKRSQLLPRKLSNQAIKGDALEVFKLLSPELRVRPEDNPYGSRILEYLTKKNPKEAFAYILFAFDGFVKKGNYEQVRDILNKYVWTSKKSNPWDYLRKGEIDNFLEFIFQNENWNETEFPISFECKIGLNFNPRNLVLALATPRYHKRVLKSGDFLSYGGIDEFILKKNPGLANYLFNLGVRLSIDIRYWKLSVHDLKILEENNYKTIAEGFLDIRTDIWKGRFEGENHIANLKKRVFLRDDQLEK